MKTYDAIVKRIQEICEEKGKSVCDIPPFSEMSPSNIYALVKGRTKISKVDTIQRFCEGADITLGEFFSNKLFENLDPEN